MDCNTLQDGWYNRCNDEKAKYERGKILTQSDTYTIPLANIPNAATISAPIIPIMVSGIDIVIPDFLFI